MPDGPITLSGISNSAISVGTAANVTNQVQASPDGPGQDLAIPDAAPAPGSWPGGDARAVRP